MRRCALVVVAVLGGCIEPVTPAEPDAAAASADARLPPPCPPPVGFLSGLLVTFVNGPASGLYELAIRIGDETVAFTADISRSPGSASALCLASSPAQAIGCQIGTPSAFIDLLTLDVLRLQIRDLDGGGGPAEVAITARAGDLAASATLTPVYETIEHGAPGAGCGSHQVAQATLDLVPAP